MMKDILILMIAAAAAAATTATMKLKSAILDFKISSSPQWIVPNMHAHTELEQHKKRI